MGTTVLLKFLHAMFLFVKEIWLRDRTFRQFVREHLAFIVMAFGFVVMSGMFFNLYIITKDQESTLAIREQDVKHLTDQVRSLSEDKKTLDERVRFWRDKYLETKDDGPATPPPPEPAKPEKPPTPVVNQPAKGSETPPTPVPTPANRGPSTSLVDRWKRLHH